MSTQAMTDTISRLQYQPKEIKVETVVEQSGQAVNWFSLVYEFKGKLASFGKFLQERQSDLLGADIVVTGISFSQGSSGLRPDDRLKGSGEWWALAVRFSVKSLGEVQDSEAAFDAAAREMGRRWREASKK